MATTQLTHGAVSTMMRTESEDSSFTPNLQVLNVKMVGKSNDRFRTILSDGEHYCQGMLATAMNPLAHSGQLTNNTCVRVNKFIINVVQEKRVCIILAMEILSQPSDRIGTPVEIVLGSAPPPPSGQAAQPMYNRTNISTNPYGGGASTPSAGTTAKVSPSPPNPYHSNAGGSSAPPIVRNLTAGGDAITPIAQLNMYQNRWTLKARITSKSDIRTWSNARGEGSLFSVELLDNSGSDVKSTFFKEAVDKFYGLLEINKVYTFSGGRLKVANAQYNTCKCQYEITFDQNAEIHLTDDAGDISAQLFDFSKIATLEAMEAGKTVDIVGVVKTVGEAVSLISKKSGQELQKCDLVVVDDSAVEISVTLWGDKAKAAPDVYQGQPVCAFRRVRLSDYGGKSLSMTSGGAVVVTPGIPETQALQTWWSGGGATATKSLSTGSGGGGKMASLADRKDIAAIKAEHLGLSNPDKPDWISFKATLTFLKKDKEGGAWYPACANANEPCKNRFKVTQTTDGHWYCDKCQGTYDNPVRRFIFSGTISDATSTTWVSFFNEQAETLFGGDVTADQVFNETFSPEAGMNQDKYDSYFAKAQHTDWIFKCKVKQEQLGEESRVKSSVYSLHPMDYAKESRDLLEAIAKF